MCQEADRYIAGIAEDRIDDDREDYNISVKGASFHKMMAIQS
jgi:hypothetical protein